MVAHRAEVRRTIEDDATVAGLGSLLHDTRQRARDYVIRAYAADLYRPTWVGLNWGVSSGILADRLAVTTAVEDAAMAAVVDGVASAEIVDDLRPFDW
jgi:hypothetical protein